MKKLDLTNVDTLSDDILEKIGEADHAFVFEKDTDNKTVYYVRVDALYRRIRLYTAEDMPYDSFGTESFNWFKDNYNIYLPTNLELRELLTNKN